MPVAIRRGSTMVITLLNCMRPAVLFTSMSLSLILPQTLSMDGCDITAVPKWIAQHFTLQAEKKSFSKVWLQDIVVSDAELTIDTKTNKMVIETIQFLWS